MPAPPKPQTSREDIRNALYDTKAYELPNRCLGLWLADGTAEDAYKSQVSDVMKRLAGMSTAELLGVVQRILDSHDDDELEALLASAGARGVQGELRNLLFATLVATLAKPEIVLRDATRNVIEITRNADKVPRVWPVALGRWTDVASAHAVVGRCQETGE